jgi:hypothetical protein
MEGRAGHAHYDRFTTTPHGVLTIYDRRFTTEDLAWHISCLAKAHELFQLTKTYNNVEE